MQCVRASERMCVDEWMDGWVGGWVGCCASACVCLFVRRKTRTGAGCLLVPSSRPVTVTATRLNLRSGAEGGEVRHPALRRMANFVTALSKTLTVFLQAPRPLAPAPPRPLSSAHALARLGWQGTQSRLLRLPATQISGPDRMRRITDRAGRRATSADPAARDTRQEARAGSRGGWPGLRSGRLTRGSWDGTGRQREARRVRARASSPRGPHHSQGADPAPATEPAA